MGLFDNVTSAVNRGTESVGRSAEKMKLKSQISEINKQRQQLAAQLGASLYEVTKDDAQLRLGRQPLYDGIAECDAQRAACQQKIDEIDAMAQAAATAASSFNCAVCGAVVGGGDLFCSGCGTPADQARPATVAPAAASGPKCAQCGAAMAEGDLFCMSCGAKAEVSQPSADAVAVTVEETVIETTIEEVE